MDSQIHCVYTAYDGFKAYLKQVMKISGLDREVGLCMLCILSKQLYHYAATCQPQRAEAKTCDKGTNTYRNGSTKSADMSLVITIALLMM